jgi:hypothetical protein
MQTKTIGSRLTAGLAACLLTTSILMAGADEINAADDENVIEDIQFGQAGVEIHLQSSRAFPVRAIPPVLQIGSSRFDLSYRPASGDLNRLIFLLSPKAFAQLREGDPMRVRYAQGLSPKEQWDFGSFVK